MSTNQPNPDLPPYPSQPGDNQPAYQDQSAYASQPAPDLPPLPNQPTYQSQDAYANQAPYTNQVPNPAQQPYAPAYQGYPQYQPAPMRPSGTTDLGGWIVTLILSAIPIVGFILLICWAAGLGGEQHQDRRNWALAQIIISVVGTVLLIIIFAATGFSFSELLNES